MVSCGPICELTADVTYEEVLALLRLIDVNLSIVAREYMTVKPGFSEGQAGEGGNTKQKKKGKGKEKEEEQAKRKQSEYDRPTKTYDVIMPEISIAAAWVIVMKFAYGLDGTERQALLPDDPLIGRPRPEDWLQELKKRKQHGEFNHQHHLEHQ